MTIEGWSFISDRRDQHRDADTRSATALLTAKNHNHNCQIAATIQDSRAVLSQRGPRDAAVTFGTVRIEVYSGIARFSLR